MHRGAKSLLKNTLRTGACLKRKNGRVASVALKFVEKQALAFFMLSTPKTNLKKQASDFHPETYC